MTADVMEMFSEPGEVTINCTRFGAAVSGALLTVFILLFDEISPKFPAEDKISVFRYSLENKFLR